MSSTNSLIGTMMTVFVATNGNAAAKYLTQQEAETYADSRASGGPWRVEPWEARLVRPLTERE